MADTKPPPIRTPPFRGSHVHLVTPQAVDKTKPDKKQYAITITLKKGDPAAEAFKKRLGAKLVESYTFKFGKPPVIAALKNYPIKDGDADPENDQWAGYWTIKASRQEAHGRPGAIDMQGNPLLTEEELYSGAWYYATVDTFAWSHETGGKGVSVSVNNVIKFKDDAKFTSRKSADEDFADLIGGTAPTSSWAPAALEDLDDL